MSGNVIYDKNDENHVNYYRKKKFILLTNCI